MASREVWRFIDSGAASGAFNMAADEFLALFPRDARPVLRFYRWQPYAISLGYHQNPARWDPARCRARGIDLVRRPTGGRAILHAHEVTYCVVVPRESRWFRLGPMELYRQVSFALLRGLGLSGLPVALAPGPAEAAGATKAASLAEACFARSARYEIQLEARKLVGSAQRRYRHAVLQHGSIILGDQHLEIFDFLSSGEAATVARLRQQLAENTASVEAMLGRRVGYEEMVANLKTGFEEALGVVLQTEALSEAERTSIREMQARYALSQGS